MASKIKTKPTKQRSQVAYAMILTARSTTVPNKKRQANRNACRNWKRGS